MKHKRIMLTFVLCLAFLITSCTKEAVTTSEENTKSEPSKLMVLWTSGDKEVAVKMVYMYTYSAKKNNWWDKIRFVVWGPSSKLLAEDKDLQQEIIKMKSVGIELIACKACADLYGVSDKLADMGFTVKYVGEDLTNMIKGDWKSLTF